MKNIDANQLGLEMVIARHHNGRHLNAQSPQASQEIDAGEAGHVHVNEQASEFFAFGRGSQTGLRIWKVPHGKARALQQDLD